jgi:hypothetical protein
MKRALTGIAVALALVASQAAAGSNAAYLQPNDRAGSESETASEMMGMPLPLAIFGLIIVIAFAVAVNHDDGPSSP